MGKISHEIDVGKRRELLFKGKFTCPGGAKVDKVIKVEAKVNMWFWTARAEHAGVIWGREEATLG